MEKINFIKVPATYGDMYEWVRQEAEKSGEKLCPYCSKRGVYPAEVKRWKGRTDCALKGFASLQKLVNTKQRKLK